MAVSPETERQWIEEWKAEWRSLSLSELYELRKELIKIRDEARKRDEEEPGRVPPYSYIPNLRVKAIDELIKEKPEIITQEIICPQCGSTLEITVWEGYGPPPPLAYYYIMPPPYGLGILRCPVCCFAVALGLGITVIVAKPWPPEEPPPVTGILDWLKANWKWLTIGGVSLGVITALARRK